jgi:DNA polymerase-1
MLAYGMSKYKLADTVRISVEEADKLITKFFKAFPAIRGFLEALGNYGKENGFIRTYRPFRRIMFFGDWYKGIEHDSSMFSRLGEIERQSKNMPIQGANADITKAAMCSIRRYIIDNNLPVMIINVVHDEIITECATEYAEEWRVIMSRLMSEAGSLVVKSIPMTVDCKVMMKWEK